MLTPGKTAYLREIVRQALKQAGPSDRAALDRMTAHMRELWQMPDLVAVPSGDGWVVDVGWPDGTMIGGATEWDAIVAACDAACGPSQLDPDTDSGDGCYEIDISEHD